jgi:hypothetical protein
MDDVLQKYSFRVGAPSVEFFLFGCTDITNKSFTTIVVVVVVTDRVMVVSHQSKNYSSANVPFGEKSFWIRSTVYSTNNHSTNGYFLDFTSII